MALCYLARPTPSFGRRPPADAVVRAAIAACALGMLCKPVMVTAPIVVLLYDRGFSPGRGREPGERRGLYVGLFATGDSCRLLAGQEHESATTAGFAIRDVTFGEFVRSQPGVVLRYLALVVWPHGLARLRVAAGRGILGVVSTLALVGGVARSGSPSAISRGSRSSSRSCWYRLGSSVVPIRDLAFEHRMYLLLALSWRARRRRVGAHRRARLPAPTERRRDRGHRDRRRRAHVADHRSQPRLPEPGRDGRTSPRSGWRTRAPTATSRKRWCKTTK
jgi:hypothetical protein